MENEKKTREELKEAIMEQLDELPMEDLEKIAGGSFWSLLKDLSAEIWDQIEKIGS